jgi:IrrE N-terminal-like domain
MYIEEVSMVVTRDPAYEAERLRASAWGNAFPVDPVLIALRLGVDVRQAPLSPNVSGALVKKLGQDPAILLNAHDHANRQRFTCAHELGHFVSRADAPDEYEYVDLRDTVFASSGVDQDEIFANQFAANLLMPKREVIRLKNEGYTSTQMALYFGVSQDAMHFRLKNLNLST